SFLRILSPLVSLLVHIPISVNIAQSKRLLLLPSLLHESMLTLELVLPLHPETMYDIPIVLISLLLLQPIVFRFSSRLLRLFLLLLGFDVLTHLLPMQTLSRSLLLGIPYKSLSSPMPTRNPLLD